MAWQESLHPSPVARSAMHQSRSSLKKSCREASFTPPAQSADQRRDQHLCPRSPLLVHHELIAADTSSQAAFITELKTRLLAYANKRRRRAFTGNAMHRADPWHFLLSTGKPLSSCARNDNPQAQVALGRCVSSSGRGGGRNREDTPAPSASTPPCHAEPFLYGQSIFWRFKIVLTKSRLRLPGQRAAGLGWRCGEHGCCGDGFQGARLLEVGLQSLRFRCRRQVVQTSECTRRLVQSG